MTVVPQQMT